jgi:hypothetical protein
MDLLVRLCVPGESKMNPFRPSLLSIWICVILAAFCFVGLLRAQF